jgi:hypothetical protein
VAPGARSVGSCQSLGVVGSHGGPMLRLYGHARWYVAVAVGVSCGGPCFLSRACGSGGCLASVVLSLE